MTVLDFLYVNSFFNIQNWCSEGQTGTTCSTSKSGNHPGMYHFEVVFILSYMYFQTFFCVSQGIVKTLKDSFGFVERADVVKDVSSVFKVFESLYVLVIPLSVCLSVPDLLPLQ